MLTAASNNFLASFSEQFSTTSTLEMPAANFLSAPKGLRQISGPLPTGCNLRVDIGENVLKVFPVRLGDVGADREMVTVAPNSVLRPTTNRETIPRQGPLPGNGAGKGFRIESLFPRAGRRASARSSTGSSTSCTISGSVLHHVEIGQLNTRARFNASRSPESFSETVTSCDRFSRARQPLGWRATVEFQGEGFGALWRGQGANGRPPLAFASRLFLSPLQFEEPMRRLNDDHE